MLKSSLLFASSASELIRYGSERHFRRTTMDYSRRTRSTPDVLHISSSSSSTSESSISSPSERRARSQSSPALLLKFTATATTTTAQATVDKKVEGGKRERAPSSPFLIGLMKLRRYGSIARSIRQGSIRGLTMG